ncbi:MAG TPA: hypothetical protein VN605_02485, partial [Thermoanaerobaculia bacterium]|nr:hypothetical protein [Thermoanaerobaculia bacterium]
IAVDERIGYSAMDAGIKHMLAGDPMGAAEFSEGIARLTGTAAAVGGVAEASIRPSSVSTPYGRAFQDQSLTALMARVRVRLGARIYRLGTLGVSETYEGQFWSFDHRMTPGFAARYGIPPANVASADFIEAGVVPRGVRFVTRLAPPSPGGVNPGGGVEVVVAPKDIRLQGFSVIK